MILNIIWLHIHLTIILRCIITRIQPKPWSNRLWMWHTNTITLIWAKIRLLTSSCLYILGFIGSYLLLLGRSLLLILGQELFEAWSCFILNCGGIARFAGLTGQTGLDTGQTARQNGLAGQFATILLFFALPPECWSPCCSLGSLVLQRLLLRPLFSNDHIFPFSILLDLLSVWTEKGFWLTCIAGTTNCPSFVADCICLRRTLQSLVAREKVLCNLQ